MVSRLDAGTVSHIGRFCSFADRRSCTNAHRSFGAVHFAYESAEWKVMNAPMRQKLDALLTYKPLANYLHFTCESDAVVTRDDYAYVAKSIPDLRITIKNNLAVLRLLLEVAERRVEFVLDDESHSIGDVNRLLSDFPDATIDTLEFTNATILPGELDAFCAINDKHARVNMVILKDTKIGRVDISALKSVGEVQIMKTVSTWSASMWDTVTIMNDATRWVHGWIPEWWRANPRRLRHMFAHSAVISDLLEVPETRESFLTFLKTTACVFNVCGSILRDPLVVPFVRFLLGATANKIRVISFSDDDGPVYVDLIMAHFRGTRVVGDTSGRAYAECLARVRDIDPVSHIMWSALAAPA